MDNIRVKIGYNTVNNSPPSSAVAKSYFGLRRTMSANLYALAKEEFAFDRRSLGEVGFTKIMYYVYILKCSNGKPYTGCTDNLKERIERHNKGYVPATKERRPVRLISYFALSNRYTAFNFEKYLKTGSGRAFLKRHEIIVE